MVTVVAMTFNIPYYFIPLYDSMGIVAVMTFTPQIPMGIVAVLTLLLEITIYHYLGIVAITMFTPPD